jgi:hypothetical protein
MPHPASMLSETGHSCALPSNAWKCAKPRNVNAPSMKLNHLNLSVVDPILSQSFLAKYFGLSISGKPNEKICFLRDDNDMVLTLTSVTLAGESEVRQLDRPSSQGCLRTRFGRPPIFSSVNHRAWASGRLSKLASRLWDNDFPRLEQRRVLRERRTQSDGKSFSLGTVDVPRPRRNAPASRA